ncbi:hypothetical protein QTP88_026919 [Uroleucon formosanum]
MILDEEQKNKSHTVPYFTVSSPTYQNIIQNAAQNYHNVPYNHHAYVQVPNNTISPNTSHRILRIPRIPHPQHSSPSAPSASTASFAPLSLPSNPLHILAGPSNQNTSPSTDGDDFCMTVMDEFEKNMDTKQSNKRLHTENTETAVKLKKIRLQNVTNLGFVEIQSVHNLRDHCHLSGQFRQTICNKCNLALKTPKFVPCFLHNVSNYDAHFIVVELGYDEKNITVIPNIEEEFISFSKYISSKFTLRFIDSCRFMASKLSNLAINLITSDLNKFRKTAKHFSNEDLTLVTRKGVYPYEFTDDWS